jgi:obscurin-RhoGEF protein
MPARFIEDMRSKEATEGATATLRCELSKVAPVEWRKGTKTLRDGDRHKLRQDGTVCELQICGLAVEDDGEYSCVCGQERTSATLTIKGKDRVWPQNLWLGVYMLSLSTALSSICGDPWPSVL